MCALLAVAGCATSLRCPRKLADPVPVFVLEQGRTSSLILPTPEGDLVRYAYGDWEFYALGKDTWLRGIAALFWPTQATLGRGSLPGPATAQNIRQRIISPIDGLHTLRAERSEVFALQERLDRLFQKHRDTLVVNRAYELSFVHHPEPYHLLHNSNSVVAGWLAAIGIEVRGPALNAICGEER